MNIDSANKCFICGTKLEDGNDVCPCCLVNQKTGMPVKPSLKRRFWQLAITLPFFLFGLVSLIILGKPVLAPCVVLMLISGFFLHASIEGHLEDWRLYKVAMEDREKYREEALARYEFMRNRENNDL